MAGDAAGLAHRRVRGHPRRLSASGRASSSACCRSAGSRSAHSSEPAWRPLLLPQGSASPYAPALRAARRAARRRDPRERPGGSRLQAAAHADRPRHGPARRAARRRARRGARARDRLDRRGRRRRRRPGKSQLRADIQRSAILRELNQLLPPSGRSSTRSRGSIRCRRSPARRRMWRRRRRGSRARRACAPPRAASCASRHRLRARDRGLGLGRRAGRSSSRTRMSSPASRTRPSRSAASRRACDAQPIAFDPPTTSPCCACPGCGLPALRLVERLGRGSGRRDPRLSRERAVRRAARAHRPHADGAHARTPTGAVPSPGC